MTNTGGSEYFVSWKGVFAADVNGPLLYSVTVGSQLGHSDLLTSISTIDDFTKVVIEADEVTEFYVVVKAVSVTGQQNVYRKIIKL